MTESESNPDPSEDSLSLDLSSLSNLDFGPSWASKPKDGGNKFAHSDQKKSNKGKSRRYSEESGAGRDRRSPRGRPDRRQGGVRGGRPSQPYLPDYDVQLQPDGAAFSALTKAMRDSCRTYELFELARLFLSKPERFVAKVFPKKDAPPEASEFFLSFPEKIGFETEDEAVAHVLANHLDLFFELEEIELEPPKGTFNVVNRCTVTGELLGPPNYHRYQHILQEHFASKIDNMTFERFLSRVETLSDKEAIDSWLESMKKGFKYKRKGTEQVFNHLEEARRHLLMDHKDKVVKRAEMCRVHGKTLERLPQNRIRRSIEAVLEQQLKFPLDFSNYLRGRLRRANFTIYKRGGKGGITFACAVKRQYRTPETLFSDSIQALIDFFENNQGVTAKQLLQNTSEEKTTEPSSLPQDNGEKLDESDKLPEWVGEKPESSTLAQDLRWLVQSGFVTEYSDGKLFAPPVRDGNVTSSPGNSAVKRSTKEEKISQPKDEQHSLSKEVEAVNDSPEPVQPENVAVETPDFSTEDALAPETDSEQARINELNAGTDSRDTIEATGDHAEGETSGDSIP